MTNAELPAGYHVENLTTLMQAVVTQYRDLLTEHEQGLWQRFQGLSAAGKSLFYRLLTRRGPLLRQDKLQYADIPDLNATLTELARCDMASINHPVDAELLLALLTRQELVQRFKPTGHNKLNKPQLLALILEQTDHTRIVTTIQHAFPYVQAHYQDAFAMYQVCFFGNSHQNLAEFVIRDLGHVQYEQYRLCRDTRYFQTRQQIEHQIVYSNARQQLEDKMFLQDAAALITLAESLPRPDHHPHLQRRYQKTLLTIARQLERLQRPTEALRYYRLCDRHPSRERQVRILKQQGDLEAALHLCHAIESNGQHPEELEFVQRVLPQLNKALGHTAAQQTKPPAHRKPPQREFELTFPQSELAVEIQAAAALSDEQHSCHYVENTLFNGLFGLLFWDVIFAAIPGAFVNAFQRGPLDLNSEDFYPRRREPIESRLQTLRSASWREIVLQHYAAKFGRANAFVYWEGLGQELLQLALQRIPPQHLESLFRRMLRHPGLYRNGFPDLIRFSHHSYELIEVKAPGDKLQANQIRWFKHFQHTGIPASVCWVRWAERPT